MKRFISIYLVLAAGLLGCPGTQTRPDDPNGSGGDKAHENATIQFSLGANDQSTGNVRQALAEYQQALVYDPNYPEAENALGLLYHLSFRQLDESEKHYLRALQIKPDYASAKNNLAALYTDEGRFDDCVRLEDEVLKDLQYKGGFLAANNEGWCLFKKGDVARGLPLIQESVRVNPEFCQGYRNLGLIYDQEGKLDMAETELSRMLKKCPDSAQAYYELGKVQLKLGKPTDAVRNFGTCRDRAKEGDPLLDECIRLEKGGKP
ncbi:MAG: social motility TPR repeat lipoprotein Tgl [Deltaproteobacteria bacterium]|nr:social motility TPR repeat lipoprotein Tgl [Deltaproteobacteria bacterium]